MGCDGLLPKTLELGPLKPLHRRCRGATARRTGTIAMQTEKIGVPLNLKLVKQDYKSYWRAYMRNRRFQGMEQSQLACTEMALDKAKKIIRREAGERKTVLDKLKEHNLIKNNLENKKGTATVKGNKSTAGVNHNHRRS